MNYKESLQSTLSKDAFWMVNKKIAMILGIDTAIFLSELISKDQYFKNRKEGNEEYFYLTAKTIKENISLSYHKQTTAIHKLREFQFIDTQLLGMPAKQYFKINYENIETFLQHSFRGILKQDLEEFKNKYLRNSKTRITYSNTNNNKVNNNKVPQVPARTEIENKNKKYVPIAKRLERIIKFKKNINITPTKLNGWANSIRQLVETDGVEIERIKKALKWYKNHYNDEYVPVIESGSSLRGKFLKLEAAIERDRKPTKKRKSGYTSKKKLKYKKAKTV